LPSDRDAVRAILAEADLAAPSPGDVERATHVRIGEVLTFVCERDEELVGVLEWRHLGSEAEILDLAVRIAARRHGFATLLLKTFLRQAASSGTQQVFLEVRESNTAAIALYRKFGFQVTGRRPNYYRCPDEAALLMQLVLER
jgi:ribosomal-protein-alanine N-acetyltransferase